MALAGVEEALVLADGRVITPEGNVRRPQRTIEVPSNTQAQRQLAAANRRISDLPALPEHTNILSIVLMYSLWGLLDNDIAVATGLSIAQVENIRNHEAYAKLQSDIIKRIEEQDQDDIRRVFTAQSRKAADKLVELVDSGDDKISLGAVNSLLDRAGHRAADVVEHRHKMEGALRIEVIERKEDKTIPSLNMVKTNGVFDYGSGS